MKRTMLTIAACAFALAAAAAGAEWHGFTDGNWYSGRKLTPADLKGKVVLVDEWGVNCGICVSLLPRIQQIWESFSSKPFLVIGSHRQGRQVDAVAALVKKNHLSYPIYDGAGVDGEPANGGGIPFLYVVNAAGKLVYSGRDERAATEAIVNALTDMPAPDSLVGNVALKRFKSYEKSLVYGANVEARLSAFKTAAAQGNGSSPEAKEARDLLAAIEKAKTDSIGRIKDEITSKPGAALTDIDKFGRTWPSARSQFAEDVQKLSANPDVRKSQQFGAALEKLRARPNNNAGQARQILAQAQSLKRQYQPLGESKDSAVAAEAASMLNELDSLISELTPASAPKSSSSSSSSRSTTTHGKKSR